MYCPFCNTEDTKVIDSRVAIEANQVRRRRECDHCNARFTTFEVAELIMPRVIKRDGSRSTFDENKLRSGMLKALEKRPISMDAIEVALRRITHKLQEMGEREVRSSILGELVMHELRVLDQVAYVRFASVYRSFQDVNAFREEIQRLEDQSQS